MENFKDKSILILGASLGLGKICAQHFAECGARLTLVSRNEATLTEVKNSCTNSTRHSVFALDVSDPTTLSNGLTDLEKKHAEFDVILHLIGGGLGLKDPLLKTEDFAKLFWTNLGYVMEVNRTFVPKMLAKRAGNLVHVGSIASQEAVGSVGYNTIKAALAAYVRSLGKVLAASNVIATGILPGGFIAPGNAMDRLKRNKPEVFNELVQTRLPRGRMSQDRELLSLVTLLCSDAASMMGGCMVPIDAGEGLTYTV